MSTPAQHLSPAHASRKGDWIQTFTGIQFWPLDPRPEEIDIVDIAHALSNQCRFAGHVKQFYSVAEHSVRCSRLVPQQDRLWALLHDASEAYLVDLPRPIKQYSRLGQYYREAENAVMFAVCDRFNLHPRAMPASVHAADNIMLVTEKRDLMKMLPKPWEDTGQQPDPQIIHPFDPRSAKNLFLHRYFEITGEHF